MNNKKILQFAGIIFIICIFGYLFFINRKVSIQDKTSKLKVVATIFPVYDMARALGGNKTEVVQLLPPGIEAHSFEPKPSDIAKINEADVFIYTSKTMEPWVSDVLKSINNKNLIVVDASQNIVMMPGVFHDEDEPVGSMDPHIWLDFDNAQVMLSNILSGLKKSDANNSGYYENNFNDYKNKLIALDNNYKSTLANCESHKIVYGGHYAFAYLAKRYNLEYSAAQGFSPNAEPSAQDLILLIDQIKRDKLAYIYYEELASPKISEMIASETKTKLLLLNAAHNLPKEDLQSGITLIDIFNNNLVNLKIGLNCK